MWRWSKKRDVSSSAPEVFLGAPVRPRVKTYSSATGFVYQYLYKGRRPIAEKGADEGTEYVFAVAQTRGHSGDIRVQLLDREISACETSAGRELLNTERYAIAKLTLFAAFDEVCDPKEFEKPLVPNAGDMHKFLTVLGRV